MLASAQRALAKHMLAVKSLSKLTDFALVAVRIKAHELRSKSKAELQSQVRVASKVLS